MSFPPVADPAWVAAIINEFWAEAPSGRQAESGEPFWDAPLVGFARGDDPLFAHLKDDIGPFLWTPLEAFRLAFPDQDLAAADLTVISYVLPQTAATRQDQRRETAYPAERWARSRHFGENFNCELRLHLAARLTAAGHPAVAPERLPDFDYRRSARRGIASNWSERHAAHIAGLGTFGLSDGLITARGKAVRLGSVVAAIAIPPTPRPYPDHQAWCLWFARGTCGACIGRCPVDAITFSGHDKDQCRQYIREVTAPYATAQFGTGATPCGLCQVGIPCEGRKPP
jgi:epoxyqueuosine reductase QueG